jgi:hypothetical protein
MDRTHADDDRPETAEAALDHEDLHRTLEHKLDRMAPSRRSVWPKDDRRSSDRLAQPREAEPPTAQRHDDIPLVDPGDQPLA